MADEPVNMAVNEGGSDAPQSSPDEPKATTSAPEEEVEARVENPTETQDAGADEGQSERAKSRQHELAQKLKEKAEEVETLRAQLEKIKGGEEPQPMADSQEVDSPNILPWMENNSPEEKEITVEDYKRDVLSTADFIVQQRLRGWQEAQKRVEQFQQDVEELESKYPQLKKGSENFDEKLSQKVVRLYQEAAAKNPDLRIGKFVDEIMSLRETGKEEGKGEATKALAQQEAEAATTPGASSGKRISSEEQLAEMLRKGEITAEEAEQYLPKE